MYIQVFEDFSKAAEQLYMAEPNKTRVALKYRHTEGSLKVKVTDDQVCLQFKTEDKADVKRIEKLVALLMRQMANKEH